MKYVIHSIENKPHQKVWLSTQIGRDNPTKGGVINELAGSIKKPTDLVDIQTERK